MAAQLWPPSNMRNTSNRSALQPELQAAAQLRGVGRLVAHPGKVQRHRFQGTGSQKFIHRIELIAKLRVIYVRPHRRKRWTQPALKGNFGRDGFGNIVHTKL